MWLVRWIKLSFGLLALLVMPLRLNAQIDRITGRNFATRSEVLARHGMVCTSVRRHGGRHRYLKTRWQRGGCGDRRKRYAGFDGAGFQWNRRRSFRNRLQREGKQ